MAEEGECSAWGGRVQALCLSRALSTGMRVTRSRALSAPGLQQPLEEGVGGGIRGEPSEAGGWESKGWV